ncbi:MAG: hypothetical protein HQL43_11530 [Alphaproteobacteria bacterium]|nr:hypothetical protein [Alphaproteobacteria bacterium]
MTLSGWDGLIPSGGFATLTHRTLPAAPHNGYLAQSPMRRLIVRRLIRPISPPLTSTSLCQLFPRPNSAYI